MMSLSMVVKFFFVIATAHAKRFHDMATHWSEFETFPDVSCYEIVFSDQSCAGGRKGRTCLSVVGQGSMQGRR